jgi:YD repeat-containing protein
MVRSPTVAYDANGNTLSDPSGKSYTWDFENRLTQAVVPGTNGGTTTFKYDPFGRRIQKSAGTHLVGCVRVIERLGHPPHPPRTQDYSKKYEHVYSSQQDCENAAKDIAKDIARDWSDMNKQQEEHEDWMENTIQWIFNKFSGH